MTDTATPRRKQQPTAQMMREQLALAATRIIDLQTALEAGLPARVVFCGGVIAGALIGGWLL